MEFIHLADLHIGKRVNGFDLSADQREMIRQILSVCDERQPDAVVIAGDVYDRGIPSTEATKIFDDFLTELVRRQIPCLIISGNHDSPQRLNFASRVMKKQGIHLSCVFEGNLEKVTFTDAWGTIDFYLMPFLRPVEVRRLYPEQEITSYDEAIRTVMETIEPTEERKVLVAHQFVINGGEVPQQSDSETISVGGIDHVDIAAFAAFDYVALGHLHRPQQVGRSTIRYGGSLLKYSFSEVEQKKGITYVKVKEKGTIETELIPLKPLHDMRQIKGPLQALTDPEIYESTNTEDYIHAVLTDEEEMVDAIGKLRAVYPNVMQLEFDNARTRDDQEMDIGEEIEKKDTLELFSEFYYKQNNQWLDEKKQRAILRILEQVEGLTEQGGDSR